MSRPSGVKGKFKIVIIKIMKMSTQEFFTNCMLISFQVENSLLNKSLSSYLELFLYHNIYFCLGCVLRIRTLSSVRLVTMCHIISEFPKN